jgi:2-polyprenyl-3-methyl-5-hydroxy-6-metoxy-1,4-benzoquinol methylase
MARRVGDTIKIGGDYQYKALTQGNPVQRFWHFSKHLSIMRYLPPSSQDNIIDVGCGSGVITSFLGESGASVVGVDGNSEAIEFANKKFSQPNITFKLGLVDDEFELAKSVDKIYCLEVIEHIYREQGRNMLNNFWRLLKPGGQVFLTTPNYKSLWPLIEWSMDKLGLAPPLAEHQHVEFYSMKKLRRLALECGFEIKVTSTTCLLSPWVAPINWTLAKRVDALESNLPGNMGSILVVVLGKPE